MTEMVRVDGHFDTSPHKIVFKYMIELGPYPQVREIPRGARLLHVEFTPGDSALTGEWWLWYEVELAERGINISRVFHTIATGVEIPKSLQHLASGVRRLRVDDKPLEVWHLYQYPSGAKVVDV